MSESSSKKGAWPHPANFPVGSAESRAAARAILAQRDEVDLRIINDMPRPKGRGPKEGCRNRYLVDGKVVEIVLAPEEDD